MCAPRRVTNVNLGGNTGAASIAQAQSSGKIPRMFLLDKINSTAAESPSGEPGADEAGKLMGELDHDIGLFAAGFEVSAVADVGFGHEAAQLLKVVADEGFSSGEGAGVFGDDVA